MHATGRRRYDVSGARGKKERGEDSGGVVWCVAGTDDHSHKVDAASLPKYRPVVVLSTQ